MSISLLDAVKSVFTDAFNSKCSNLLGETAANTRKSTHSAITVALTCILHRASYMEDAAKIYSLSKQASGSDFFGQVHELTISAAGGLTAGSALLTKGTDFARSLFAGRTDAVVKEISRHTGVSIPSASFVTGVASFAALDAIGRQIANANLDVKGMVEWLATQRDSIINAIPSGLQVKQALDIKTYPGEKVAKSRRNTALFVIIALIVILLVVFLLYRYYNNTNSSTAFSTNDTLVTTPSTTLAAPAANDGITTQITLQNGIVLTVYKGGTEEKLINFLNDPNAKLDNKNGNWFYFTRINFANNSASLLLESETQLKNIVSILGVFPQAKIKIGGFSDNVGDSEANVKLSQQRADNVVAKLKELGAKNSQLDGAKGYGPAMPVGDNGTEDGRAMNRRISLDVVAK